MKIRFLLFLLFPFFIQAQTVSKDRFVAKNKAVVWTEKFEIKDMDTPIIVETMRQHLLSKSCVQLEVVQQNGVFEGVFVQSPFAGLFAARFRIDFLYEGYIVTVSEITEQKGLTLENIILKSNGTFVENFPDRIEKMDNALWSFFLITH